MSTAQIKQDIHRNAVNLIAAGMGYRKVLFGPNGAPLPPSAVFGYRRRAAKREGSLKNWIPSKLGSTSAEAYERERIVERSIDLIQNDPNAAGVIDGIANTVIGAGLMPHSAIDIEALGIAKKKIRKAQVEQKAVFQRWAPYADAGGRMSFGGIQYLCERSRLQFGEFLVLLPMIKDPVRPYSLACQVAHPLRLKTPNDLKGKDYIVDGVELGDHGEPLAYWIKRVAPRKNQESLADISANFVRVMAKQGHRWKVIHGFVQQEPEQVRGVAVLAPAMKTFKDFSDLLDAELVSNIVTAAFSLFIEVPDGIDPGDYAKAFAGMEETGTNEDGSSKTDRYQELDPGSIMYGNQGEKPHPIAATRPGNTFDPFTKILKKSISMATGIPMHILFKDVDGANMAAIRMAMLEAWRVYTIHRARAGEHWQKPYTMLMEEAYLLGEITIKNFYFVMAALTKCEWRGAPKGDIEPVKAITADIMAINNNLKTRAQVIAERDGDDWRATLDQLEEENELLDEKNLNEKPEADTGKGAGDNGRPAKR